MDNQAYEIKIPFFLGRKHFTEKMTVEDLKSISLPVIAEATETVAFAMEKAGLRKGEIGLVLLAGGSSQLPGVSESVFEHTGVRPQTIPCDVMYAVAYGAALYHRRIFQLPSSKRESRILGDGLGVLTNDGGVTGFKLLLSHNQKLPASAKYDFDVEKGQDIATISLRCEIGANDSKTRPLKTKDLKLLKDAKKIRVEIRVDTNRLIALNAYDPENPKDQVVMQVNKDELTEYEISEMRQQYGIIVDISSTKKNNGMAHPCIGIDLGTTTSELAYVNRFGDPDPKCLENEEFIRNYDKYCYPSIVYFPDGFSSPEVASARAVVEFESNPGNVYHSFKIADRSKELGEIDGIPIRVDTLSAHIISKIWNDARKSYLSGSGELSSAVITVPATFGPDECQDTYNAAKLAGIKDITLIDEPTAAFLYYQYLFPNLANAGIKNILVFDFGGGTADVAILDIREDPGVAPGTYKDTLFQVLATSGNPNCGGKHIDKAIADYLIKSFESKNGVTLDQETVAVARIRKEAVDAKIALSNLSSGEDY